MHINRGHIVQMKLYSVINQSYCNIKYSFLKNLCYIKLTVNTQPVTSPADSVLKRDTEKSLRSNELTL